MNKPINLIYIPVMVYISGDKQLVTEEEGSP